MDDARHDTYDLILNEMLSLISPEASERDTQYVLGYIGDYPIVVMMVGHTADMKALRGKLEIMGRQLSDDESLPFPETLEEIRKQLGNEWQWASHNPVASVHVLLKCSDVTWFLGEAIAGVYIPS